MGSGFQEILSEGLHLPSQGILREGYERIVETGAITLTMSWWKPSSRMSVPELLSVLLERRFSDMVGVVVECGERVTEKGGL